MAGQVTVRDVIFGIIIFTAIISGSFYLIGAVAPSTEDSFSGDGGYNATINKFSSIQVNMNTTAGTFRNSNQKQSSLGILDDLLKTSWGAISTVWTSIDTMNIILQDIGDSFGIPLWFIQTITMFIVLTIIFALMAAWFRWLI